MAGVLPPMSAKQKKKHLKAVQPKLRVFRAKEPLMSVFMWGINYSINELNHVNIPVMLMNDDFKSHSKVRVDNHLFNKDNMPSHFKFKEYCPLVFRNLRERFGLEEELYLNAFSKSPVESTASGRSGARILLSYDQRFLIKTMVSEEVAEVHRILKDYHQHIVECHASTLLPQYMGMYRVTVNDQETYLAVMRHVFSPRLIVHKKYDLKGSTVARQASEREKQKDLPTFKDNDFVNDGITIYVGKEAKEKIMAKLQVDVEFLTKLNLMDYSLLVGIHDIQRAEQEAAEAEAAAAAAPGEDPDAPQNGVEGGDPEPEGEEDEGAVDLSTPNVSMLAPTPPDSPTLQHLNNPFCGSFDPALEMFAVRSEEGKEEIYFMALIDILTHYGVKKRSAAAAKSVKYGANAEISTVKPEQYARRFLEFVGKVLE